ncbi:MAG: alpha/beta hydrolase [Bacilli bacterium]
MKKWLSRFVILNIIVAPIIIFFVTGYFVFDRSMQMVTNEETSNRIEIEKVEEYGFSVQNFEKTYTVTEGEIPSSFQEHTIPTYWLSKSNEKKKDTIILVHGLGGSHITVYPVAEHFLKKGYNVVTYDQRSSGANTAKYTTYGVWESKDLSDVLQNVRKSIGEDKKIGVWGTSFGGATVGLFLGSDVANENVDWAILDSPISDIESILSQSMKKIGTPFPIKWNIVAGDVMTKLRLGFSYSDSVVAQHIKRTKVPVLIIHSETDTQTPPYMAEAIYDAIQSKKKMYTFKQGAHAVLFYTYPKEYFSQVDDWIKDF